MALPSQLLWVYPGKHWNITYTSGTEWHCPCSYYRFIHRRQLWIFHRGIRKYSPWKSVLKSAKAGNIKVRKNSAGHINTTQTLIPTPLWKWTLKSITCIYTTSIHLLLILVHCGDDARAFYALTSHMPRESSWHKNRQNQSRKYR